MEELAREARQYGALIEAAGIVASLIVTGVLAVIAARSLRAANRQAEASAQQAEASDAATVEMRREVEESRRQHLLSTAPIVKASRPQPLYSGPGRGHESVEPYLASQIAIYGATEATALDLRIEVLAENDDGTATNFRGGEAVVAMLAPGEEQTVWVDTTRLLNMDYSAWSQAARWSDPEPPMYTYRRVLITFTCRSPLGSVVTQTFRWHIRREARDDYAWEVVRLEIVPDPARPDDRVIVEPPTR